MPNLFILTASQSSSAAKTQAGTNSPEKGGGVFLSQRGETYDYEPGENWYTNYEDIVKAGEKEALFELKAGGYQASLRRPKSIHGEPPAAPAEWDHLVVSASREESELLKGHEIDVMEALIEALHKLPNGQRRMMAISFAHDDTNNLHWHINLHRFAVDHEAKTISTSFDLTKNSILHQQLARINEVMRERGLLELSDVVSHDGRSLSADKGTSAVVHEDIKRAMEESGAVDHTEPQTSIRRNVIAPDLARIASAEESTRKELSKVTAEIERLRLLQSEKAQNLADLQSSKEALKERELALSEKEEAVTALDVAIAERNEFEERAIKAEATLDDFTQKTLQQAGVIDELKMQVEDFEAVIEEKDEQIVGLETALADKDQTIVTTLAVSQEWEKAARTEIETHTETIQQRDSLAEQVNVLEERLQSQNKQFAEELAELQEATQAQVKSLSNQLNQQTERATDFINQLSKQNEAAQNQIASLNSQLQQQTQDFAKQLKKQAESFENQLKRFSKTKPSNKSEPKPAQNTAIKPDVAQQKPSGPVNAPKTKDGKLGRDAINARLKESIAKSKESAEKQEGDQDQNGPDQEHDE